MIEPLRTDDSILLVIDVQEKLATAMDPAVRDRAVANVVRLIKGAGIFEVPVLVTEQYPEGLGPTVEPVREALAELPEAPTTIVKTEFDVCCNSAFAGCSLRGAKGRGTWIVAGMEAHICVWQTVRSLCGQAKVHVASDATCSRDSNNHRVAEGLWAQAGAVVSSTETVLFDLVRQSDAQGFKAVSHLVR